MKKNKKAKRDGLVNIDASPVKNLFVELATPEGVILTSSIPQMKDLGPDGYRYTMWGLDKTGERCLIVLSADRDGISLRKNWATKYPTMKTVTGSIVATENQKFAAQKIVNLCAKEEGLLIMDKTARPVVIPVGTTGMRYGYTMCATQGERRGFATMENGTDSVQFSEVTPKFL